MDWVLGYYVYTYTKFWKIQDISAMADWIYHRIENDRNFNLYRTILIDLQNKFTNSSYLNFAQKTLLYSDPGVSILMSFQLCRICQEMPYISLKFLLFIFIVHNLF